MSINISELELSLLKELKEALDVLLVLTEKLCSEDTDLLEADLAFLLTFSWLEDLGTEIATELRLNLWKEYEK